MDLFRHKCASEDVDIALVAEPNKNMTKYSAKWVTDKKTDAAIYLPLNKIMVNKTGQGNGYVWIENEDIVIYSCYISPATNVEEFQQFLRELSNEVRDHSKKLLIGGDFNAKSYSWGSPREDRKGSILAEWASEVDLTILNNGNVPTFERNGGSSFIDITLCSSSLARLVEKWYVAEEENLSYHRNIHIEIINVTKVIQEMKPKKGWTYKAEKKEQLFKKIEEEMKRQNYTHTAKEISETLESACNTVLKKKYTNTKRKAAYWWNEEISELRNESLRMKRRVTRLNRQTNISEVRRNEIQNQYRECRNELKKAIRKAKRQAWNTLREEIDRDLWGTGYKIVTGKIGLRSIVTLTDDEQMRVAEELFPKHQTKIWPKIAVKQEDIPICTREEIVVAGRRIKTGKAAGPDGIPPEVIKAIAEQRPELMERTLNGIIKQGCFPREWKVGRLMLIEKPGKIDGRTTYRPLCLLNVVAKLLEQIINRRLIDEMEEKGALSSMQFGFRKGMSTVDAIKKVQDSTREANNFAVMITLDVKNAFNSASWNGIIKILKKRQISPYIIKLICSYLENRKILVGEKQSMDMTCGVPQGSVLGPTLWNLYYDDVLREEMPDGTTMVAYADDLALIVCGKDREEIEDNIAWTMGRINIWMSKSGLQLAPHKTEAVVLAGRRTIKTVTVRTGTVAIESQRSLKYLGILIGHNMSMGQHIVGAARRADRTAVALTRLMPNIGGPKAGRRRILSSVVNSILLYGAPAWRDWAQRGRYRKILESTQRKTAIRIASAYRTVSTKAIQVIAGTIPIHLLVAERTYDKAANKREQKARARQNTMTRWQEEWTNETTTAQWTKKLIPEVTPWVNRKHGEVGYYLTQFLSGHGQFNSYLHRLNLIDQSECTYCGGRDTPEHVVMECARWNTTRDRLAREIGEQVTTESIIRHMLSSEEKWKAIERAISDIIKTKKTEERVNEQ